MKCLDNNQEIDNIYLDLQNAFDKVSYEYLLNVTQSDKTSLIAV